MRIEKRYINGERVDTVKIFLDGGISAEEIEALKSEHGEVLEHSIVLYKPPIPQAEAERLKAAVDDLAKIDLSTALKADLVTAVSKLCGVKPEGVK